MIKKEKVAYSSKSGAEAQLKKIEQMGGKGSISKKDNSTYIISFYFPDEDGSLSKKFELGTPVVYHFMQNGKQFELTGEVIKSGKTTTPKAISIYGHRLSILDRNIVMPNWLNVENFYDGNRRREKRLSFKLKK